MNSFGEIYQLATPVPCSILLTQLSNNMLCQTPKRDKKALFDTLSRTINKFNKYVQFKNKPRTQDTQINKSKTINFEHRQTNKVKQFKQNNWQIYFIIRRHSWFRKHMLNKSFCQNRFNILLYVLNGKIQRDKNTVLKDTKWN